MNESRTQVNEIIHHFKILIISPLKFNSRPLFLSFPLDNKNKFKFKKKTTENKKFSLIFFIRPNKSFLHSIEFSKHFLCKLSFKKICLIVLFIYFYLQGFLIFRRLVYVYCMMYSKKPFIRGIKENC